MFHPGFRIEHIEIPWDDADWAFICERVDQFWTDHILTGEPPAMTGDDSEVEALGRVYPTGTLAAVEIDPELHVRWSEARDARLASEKAEQTAANEIRAAIGDAEAATVAGIVVATWKNNSTERLDPRAEKPTKPRSKVAPIPERAARFYNPTPTRVLRPVTPKENAA